MLQQRFSNQKIGVSSHVKVTLQILCYKRLWHQVFSSSSRAIFINGFYLAVMIILLNDFTLTFLKRLIDVRLHPTQ